MLLRSGSHLQYHELLDKPALAESPPANQQVLTAPAGSVVIMHRSCDAPNHTLTLTLRLACQHSSSPAHTLWLWSGCGTVPSPTYPVARRTAG